MEVAEQVREVSQRLLSATIQRVEELAREQRELALQQGSTKRSLEALLGVSAKVDSAKVDIDGFQLELSRWDQERRTFQAEATTGLAGLRDDLGSLRGALERHEGSVSGLERSLERLAGEVVKAQDCASSLREYFSDRLEQQNRDLGSKAHDLEVKLVTVETQQHRLADEVWAACTKSSNTSSGLLELQGLLQTHGADLSALRDEKASRQQLQSLQEEFAALQREAKEHVKGLRERLGSLLSDVRSHVEVASGTMAAQSAELLKEGQRVQGEEMRRWQQACAEALEVVESGGRRVAALEEAVAAAKAETEAAASRAAADVQELQKAAVLEKERHEEREKALEAKLGKAATTAEAAEKEADQLRTVLCSLVRAGRVAAAMEAQDARDRSSMALMGYKPAVSLDERCLSCSGGSKQILSGFKMACLQYAPGPVLFERKHYERRELLELQEALVEQARAAMDETSPPPPAPRAKPLPNAARVGSLPPLSARGAVSR